MVDAKIEGWHSFLTVQFVLNRIYLDILNCVNSILFTIEFIDKGAIDIDALTEGIFLIVIVICTLYMILSLKISPLILRIKVLLEPIIKLYFIELCLLLHHLVKILPLRRGRLCRRCRRHKG